MLVAYIKNGSTAFFNVPKEYNEVLSKHNRYDYYREFYVGTFINSIHSKDIIDNMNVDKFYVNIFEKGDYYEIDKSTAMKLYDKFSKELRLLEKEEASIKL